MATAPVVPAAAPVAAPTPIPAAQPAPITSTPAPAAAPVSPAAGVPPTPAAPSGAQPPTRPTQAEYGNDHSTYLAAEFAWQREMEVFKAENPDAVVPGDEDSAPAEVPADAAPAEETQLAEGETKPTEPETPEIEEEPVFIEPESELIPQAFNELINGDKTLKAAIDSNPKAKGAIMKLAREHKELSQFKGIFPNADAATFARKEAASKVALRMQFRTADTPEAMETAFQSFMQEFAEIGPDGKQVIDETGTPVYGDDLYAFGEHVVSRYADSSTAMVEARLAANQYATPEAKQRDEDLKIALDIIKGDLHPSDTTPADPDLSGLSPDVRAQVQERLDEAKRIEAENAAREKGKGKINRAEQRQKGTTEFFQKSAARLWPQVDKIVERLRSAGAVIPDWQLQIKDTRTNTNAFQQQVGSRIEALVKADPDTANNMLQLELQYLANPTEETMNKRVEYFDQILQSKDHTGRSLLNRTVSDVIHKHGMSVAEAPKTTSDTAPTASKEPRQGTAVRPHAMTADEAWSQAVGQLAKELPGWGVMTKAEQMSHIYPRQRQLLSR